ncbi:MAG: hypothetical protein JSU61_10985, partial [Fidelibacterota bacterium]
MVKRFPGIGTKLRLVLAVGILTIQAVGQDAFEQSAMRRVLSSEDIKTAGLTHLADILLLLDDWSIASLDGFHWKMSVNGLSSFQEQDWIVMVDGQRIDLKAFGTVYLNHLPLSLDLIDSIQVFSVPVIHEGEFADRGLIHIHTQEAKSGISFQGSEVVGQKTGDPGPYLFTDFTSPNVDHILPGYTLSVRYKASSWNAIANLVVNQYAATYSVIGKLNHEMISDWPGM